MEGARNTYSTLQKFWCNTESPRDESQIDVGIPNFENVQASIYQVMHMIQVCLTSFFHILLLAHQHPGPELCIITQAMGMW